MKKIEFFRMNLIKYALITTSSPYYNSNTFTDGPNNIFVNIDNWEEDNETYLRSPKITTTNERRFDRQFRRGYDVEVEFNAETGQWKGVAKRI